MCQADSHASRTWFSSVLVSRCSSDLELICQAGRCHVNRHSRVLLHECGCNELAFQGLGIASHGALSEAIYRRTRSKFTIPALTSKSNLKLSKLVLVINSKSFFYISMVNTFSGCCWFCTFSINRFMVRRIILLNGVMPKPNALRDLLP